MIGRKTVRRVRTAFLLIPLLLSMLWTGAGPAHSAEVYKFGVVPQFEPRKLAKIWIPVLTELEKRTGLTFKMIGSPKIPNFETSFLAGEFDFAYMNPYHAMLANTKGGYVPLVRDGGRKLSGILVVRSDSPFRKLADLNGQKVSFPAPNALGASLLMRAELETLHRVKTRPIYVDTHSSVYLNVVLKKTSAGGGVKSTLSKQKDAIRKKLRVLYTTRKMEPHPVMAHQRIPADIRRKVQEAFLKMGKTREGASLLAKIPILKIIKAKAEDYNVLSTWGLEGFYVRQ